MNIITWKWFISSYTLDATIQIWISMFKFLFTVNGKSYCISQIKSILINTIQIQTTVFMKTINIRVAYFYEEDEQWLDLWAKQFPFSEEKTNDYEGPSWQLFNEKEIIAFPWKSTKVHIFLNFTPFHNHRSLPLYFMSIGTMICNFLRILSKYADVTFQMLQILQNW